MCARGGEVGSRQSREGFAFLNLKIENMAGRSLGGPNGTPPPPSSLYESMVDIDSYDETSTSRLGCSGGFD